MNYLAHAFLSGGDPALITGNMIADFVKGRAALEGFAPEIQEGIRLHRFIDETADKHPAMARAKLYFRPAYRLYSGAIIDTLMDHYLANDPKAFGSEAALKTFSTGIYAVLENNKPVLPARFAGMLPYMQSQDWLYNYRTMPGIRNALGRLHRRATSMPPPDEAYAVFVGHYYILAQCYYELMDDLITSVKSFPAAGRAAREA